MPRLPQADAAFVEEAKLRDYLLNVDHPDGGSKAALLLALGFQRDAPEVLAQALLEQGRTNDATEVASAFGTRYIVDAPLRTPSGRMLPVRTIWEVKDGPPRFITAYPMQVRS